MYCYLGLVESIEDRSHRVPRIRALHIRARLCFIKVGDLADIGDGLTSPYCERRQGIARGIPRQEPSVERASEHERRRSCYNMSKRAATAHAASRIAHAQTLSERPISAGDADSHAKIHASDPSLGRLLGRTHGSKTERRLTNHLQKKNQGQLANIKRQEGR